MAEKKKITYVEAIDCALNGNLTAEVADRLRDLSKSLTNKSVDKKTAEKRERNQMGKELIMANLVPGREYRIGEIWKIVSSASEDFYQQFEPTQVSYLVTSLHYPDCRLARIERKGLAYFYIPENGIVEDDN